MQDGEAITVRVLDIFLGTAVIQQPTGDLDEMPLYSLPGGVQVGDQVRLTVDGGDCDVELLHPTGLPA